MMIIRFARYYIGGGQFGVWREKKIIGQGHCSLYLSLVLTLHQRFVSSTVNMEVLICHLQLIVDVKHIFLIYNLVNRIFGYFLPFFILRNNIL